MLTLSPAAAAAAAAQGTFVWRILSSACWAANSTAVANSSSSSSSSNDRQSLAADAGVKMGCLWAANRCRQQQQQQSSTQGTLYGVISAVFARLLRNVRWLERRISSSSSSRAVIKAQCLLGCCAMQGD
jgi:hypothetical protein